MNLRGIPDWFTKRQSTNKVLSVSRRTSGGVPHGGDKWLNNCKRGSDYERLPLKPN